MQLTTDVFIGYTDTHALVYDPSGYVIVRVKRMGMYVPDDLKYLFSKFTVVAVKRDHVPVGLTRAHKVRDEDVWAHFIVTIEGLASLDSIATDLRAAGSHV